jgi:hypothetical protein
MPLNSRKSPNRPEETAGRLAELAEILALGLMRLRARKSSELSRHEGERSLDFAAEQSGRGTSEILQERP